ncbi:MAG: hypothetical protein NZ777_12050 [Pseudomonadales bacterium]|nr:hypothetical protein [Pseudomonadales bacterium]
MHPGSALAMLEGVLVDAGRGTLVEGALVELSVMLSLAYCATRAQLLFKH